MTQSRNDADVAFIKALAELLNENDLSEVSVKRDYGENDSLNVKVSKISAQPAQIQYAPAPVAASAPSAPAAAPSEAPADPAQHPGAVTSPMVGTAYLAAEPGAANFVSIGADSFFSSFIRLRLRLRFSHRFIAIRRKELPHITGEGRGILGQLR